MIEDHRLSLKEWMAIDKSVLRATGLKLREKLIMSNVIGPVTVEAGSPKENEVSQSEQEAQRIRGLLRPQWAGIREDLIPQGYVVIAGKLTPSHERAKQAVRDLLMWVGEDPDRQGLRDTPERVVRALTEMTEGYRANPEWILSKVFEEDHDEMVVVRGIAFTSLCEHHLLPFSGTADVGYIPKIDDEGRGKVVGLSKIARLVECFARRLTIQERLTKQIASEIEKRLGAIGVGVVIRASHSCMGCRGVKKPSAMMVTSVMLGVLRTDTAARAEFLHLCEG